MALLEQKEKQLEELKAELYILREVINNLNDGVLISDKNGKVIVYNPSMEEMEEYKSSDMIGKYILDAYGYQDVEKSEHMQVLSSGIPIENKYKAHAFNGGKPIYKTYSTQPVSYQGENIAVFSISRDETKLKDLLSEVLDLKKQAYKINHPDMLIKRNGTQFDFAHIVGSSEKTIMLIKEAQSISSLDSTVLLVGDTGTGKEVFAQSIHNFGKNQNHPFVGINCSAIPETMLESILFGSRKGAYTGAVDMAGLFEEAGHGTIFLDELNSMPVEMQTKLLRVLEQRTVRRLGDNIVRPIHCRVLCAINEDPYHLIRNGRLRQDLFYRVSAYILNIPALKERGNDLFELANYYINQNNELMQKNISTIEQDLQKWMAYYEWPGNIRELKHFVDGTMLRTSKEETELMS